MVEPHIRAAAAGDVPAVARIVEQAYRGYVARIGRPPGPMLDDYAARVVEGAVWVIAEGPSPAGIIVLVPRPDHLLLDNIAVAPVHQGTGLGGFWPLPRRKRRGAATARSGSIRT